MMILLQQQMSAWFPRWIRGVINPNFYEVGVRRACVDFLTRKALKNNDIYCICITTMDYA